MGSLTSSDKQYFINLIRNDVDGKIQEAETKAGYNQEELRKQLIVEVSEEAGVNTELKNIKAWEDQVQKLEDKIKATKKDVHSLLNIKKFGNSYYNSPQDRTKLPLLPG